MAQEQTILEFIRNSLKPTDLAGYGSSAHVFNIADPRFANYVMRVKSSFYNNDVLINKYHPDKLAEYNNNLISSTTLIPVDYGLGARNLGQPLVEAVVLDGDKEGNPRRISNIQFLRKQPGISLRQLSLKGSEQSQELDPRLRLYDGYASALEKIAKLPDNAYEDFLEDTDVFNKNGRHTDANPGNIMYSEEHLRWVDAPQEMGGALPLDGVIRALTGTAYYDIEDGPYYYKYKSKASPPETAGEKIEQRIAIAVQDIKQKIICAAQKTNFSSHHDLKKELIFKQVSKIDHLGTLKLSDTPAQLLEMLKEVEVYTTSVQR